MLTACIEDCMHSLKVSIFSMVSLLDKDVVASLEAVKCLQVIKVLIMVSVQTLSDNFGICPTQ